MHVTCPPPSLATVVGRAGSDKRQFRFTLNRELYTGYLYSALSAHHIEAPGHDEYYDLLDGEFFGTFFTESLSALADTTLARASRVTGRDNPLPVVQYVNEEQRAVRCFFEAQCQRKWWAGNSTAPLPKKVLLDDIKQAEVWRMKQLGKGAQKW